MIDQPHIENKVIKIERGFSRFDSEQLCSTHGKAEWRISDLVALVNEYGLKSFHLPLQFIDIQSHYFKCDDLYEFMQHMKMVQEADLDRPIIMSHRGQILDGRHRICKAIMEGRTHILAVKFEFDVKPTRLA